MKSVLLIGALSCQFGTYCAGADASISTGSRNLAIELVGYQPITDVSDEVRAKKANNVCVFGVLKRCS